MIPWPNPNTLGPMGIRRVLVQATFPAMVQAYDVALDAATVLALQNDDFAVLVRTVEKWRVVAAWYIEEAEKAEPEQKNQENRECPF